MKLLMGYQLPLVHEAAHRPLVEMRCIQHRSKEFSAGCYKQIQHIWNILFGLRDWLAPIPNSFDWNIRFFAFDWIAFDWPCTLFFLM